MEINGSGSEESRQVQVRFVTKLAPPLKAPTTSISVPSDINRMGLSEIVNLLLKNGDSDFQPRPFDFLIDGELVRMSLGEFLLAKGISAEKILEIEYIKSVAPRKQEEPCMHDDWVSAVDGSSPSFVLTGCYDSLGRVWKSGGLCTHTLVGHSDAITSVSIINPKGGECGTDFCFVTASKDHTLRLWKVDAADTLNHHTNITALKVLSGHASSVQSVSAEPSGEMICSGSWDCSIKLWKTVSDVDGDSVLKKRKVDAETATHEECQVEGDAISSLEGHRQCVSSVIWPDRETIYSASWDHCVRRWDVETGRDFLNLVDDGTMVCGKALNCIDVGGEGSVLIAAGGSDPVLRIWDPRKPGTLAPVFQFSSHSSWITACKWHAKSWFHLISASYDGKIMLWDLRTAWPLAVIESHKDKVLCADWWKGDTVVSGGADSNLCISSGISI